jgi:hypothetical protein
MASCTSQTNARQRAYRNTESVFIVGMFSRSHLRSSDKSSRSAHCMLPGGQGEVETKFGLQGRSCFCFSELKSWDEPGASLPFWAPATTTLDILPTRFIYHGMAGVPKLRRLPSDPTLPVRPATRHPLPSEHSVYSSLFQSVWMMRQMQRRRNIRSGLGSSQGMESVRQCAYPL